MRFELTNIGPDLAMQMLEKNEKNRKINPYRITKLINDIKGGAWTISPTPISFSPDGTLLDGQHRLTAIVRAGATIPVYIAYDVPEDTIFDRGLERSSGDALFMRGLISKQMSMGKVQALINRYLSEANGELTPKLMSDVSKASFINCYESLISKAVKISKAGATNGVCSRRAGSQAAFLGALIKGIPEEVLKEFAIVANTGFMERKDQSAAIVYRNYLLENDTGGGRQMASRICQCAEMAINDYVNKTPRKKRYSELKHVYITPFVTA